MKTLTQNIIFVSIFAVCIAFLFSQCLSCATGDKGVPEKYVDIINQAMSPEQEPTPEPTVKPEPEDLLLFINTVKFVDGDKETTGKLLYDKDTSTFYMRMDESNQLFLLDAQFKFIEEVEK